MNSYEMRKALEEAGENSYLVSLLFYVQNMSEFTAYDRGQEAVFSEVAAGSPQACPFHSSFKS